MKLKYLLYPIMALVGGIALTACDSGSSNGNAGNDVMRRAEQSCQYYSFDQAQYDRCVQDYLDNNSYDNRGVNGSYRYSWKSDEIRVSTDDQKRALRRLLLREGACNDGSAVLNRCKDMHEQFKLKLEANSLTDNTEVLITVYPIQDNFQGQPLRQEIVRRGTLTKRFEGTELVVDVDGIFFSVRSAALVASRMVLGLAFQGDEIGDGSAYYDEYTSYNNNNRYTNVNYNDPYYNDPYYNNNNDRYCDDLYYQDRYRWERECY